MMRNHRLGHVWLSGHIFLRDAHHAAAFDQTILEVVAPFVRLARQRGWIRRYFYIRYAERGPHIRLRLFGDREQLAETVEPALEEHLAAALPAARRGVPHEGSVQGERSSTLPCLRWIPYEPEYVRYGGEDGVAVAERLFFHSSNLTIELLAQLNPGDTPKRLGLGLAAMVTLLGAFSEEPGDVAGLTDLHRDQYAGVWTGPGDSLTWTSRFDAGYARHARALEDQVIAVWDAVRNHHALPAPLARYHRAVTAIRGQLVHLLARERLSCDDARARDWSQVMRTLIPSYLHMTNNRMGVSPIEESYLSHVIGRALGAGSLR